MILHINVQDSGADMKTISFQNRLAALPTFKVMNLDKLLPVAALLSAVLLWGGSFAAMRLSVGAMSPWSVMWLRMIIALLVILPFAGRLRLSGYQSGDWRLLLPMVLLQPCLYFLLESYALKFTTSSQAGVISASVPLMVTVGAWLVLGEPLSRKTLMGLFFSVGGVAALSINGQDAISALNNPLLGNSLEICAMASAALNMILVKRLCNRYSPWLLTALQVAAGSLFFSPGLVLLFSGGTPQWTVTLVAAILFLGTFVTLGAFGLYNWAMSRIPASKASIFINLVPVTAVAIGWTVMGERLNPVQCIAAVTVITGVALSQMGNTPT